VTRDDPKNRRIHGAGRSSDDAPGAAPSPGPMKVPAEKLRDVLGITHVNFVAQKHQLAIVDSSLSGAPIELHETPSV
jgi:hypothetical protein